MGVTSRLALPYPELADRAIVPDDVRDLALALDRAAIIDQGGAASRPVSTSASPGVRGRFYWATDESVLYHDTGTAWAAINPSLVTNGPAGTGSLRTLGTSGTSAAAGNDARLSNQRVPTDASVTAAKVASTLLPSQGAGGAVEALRAIGTGAGRVAAGNDTRLSNQRTPTDSSVGWAKTGVGGNGLAEGAVGVYRGATYAHTIGAKVAFDTLDYNYGATLVDGAVYVSFAGLWHVTATVTVSGGDAISGRLYIGTIEVDYAYAPAAPTATRELHFAGTRRIAANDAISILFDTTTSILNGRQRTHMNVHCVGRMP